MQSGAGLKNITNKHLKIKIIKMTKTNKKTKIYMTKKRKHKIFMRNSIIITIAFFLGVAFTGNAQVKLDNEVSYQTPDITYKALRIAPVVIESPEIRYANLLKGNKVFSEYINGIKVKRNNPGNLRCHNQPNSTCVNGFANFPNIVIGFRALIKQVELDQSRDLSLRQFLTKYSPPHENNTEHLIRRASKVLNLEEKELINYLDTIKLAQFMANQEFSVKIVEF